MKRRWVFPLAAGMSFLLVASAAAQDVCTPVAPKKWEGTITFGGGWVGTTTFEQGGCSWSGADQLNGSDAVVWDVTGYGGVTASITQSPSPAVHRGLQGYFLNENCERGGSWGMTEPNTPYAIGVPEGAKWVVIFQQYGAVNTTVTMETAGRECEEEVVTPKPPKKKKKPKKG